MCIPEKESSLGDEPPAEGESAADDETQTPSVLDIQQEEGSIEPSVEDNTDTGPNKFNLVAGIAIGAGVTALGAVVIYLIAGRKRK